MNTKQVNNILKNTLLEFYNMIMKDSSYHLTEIKDISPNGYITITGTFDNFYVVEIIFKGTKIIKNDWIGNIDDKP